MARSQVTRFWQTVARWLPGIAAIFKKYISESKSAFLHYLASSLTADFSILTHDSMQFDNDVWRYNFTPSLLRVNYNSDRNSINHIPPLKNLPNYNLWWPSNCRRVQHTYRFLQHRWLHFQSRRKRLHLPCLQNTKIWNFRNKSTSAISNWNNRGMHQDWNQLQRMDKKMERHEKCLRREKICCLLQQIQSNSNNFFSSPYRAEEQDKI